MLEYIRCFILIEEDVIKLENYETAKKYFFSFNTYMNNFEFGINKDDVSNNINNSKPILSHITLLIGCAIPILLSEVNNNNNNNRMLFLPFLGLMTIGIGDSFASIFGIYYYCCYGYYHFYFCYC